MRKWLWVVMDEQENSWLTCANRYVYDNGGTRRVRGLARCIKAGFEVRNWAVTWRSMLKVLDRSYGLDPVALACIGFLNLLVGIPYRWSWALHHFAFQLCISRWGGRL